LPLLRNQDPGVKVRRRISFKATNLIGSFQDDVKSKFKTQSIPDIQLLLTYFEPALTVRVARVRSTAYNVSDVGNLSERMYLKTKSHFQHGGLFA
jgi:hypothetical protein